MLAVLSLGALYLGVRYSERKLSTEVPTDEVSEYLTKRESLSRLAVNTDLRPQEYQIRDDASYLSGHEGQAKDTAAFLDFFGMGHLSVNEGNRLLERNFHELTPREENPLLQTNYGRSYEDVFYSR